LEFDKRQTQQHNPHCSRCNVTTKKEERHD
jgi:hypothetical protein